MSESTPDVATQPGDELLLELADDYLRRYRAGEQPTVDEYVGKHPELVDRIHELFPAMIAMEQTGPGATVDLAPPTERVGATIGRYKLLERIGEGGFGVVYMAEQQEPVRRKVALKVIKPGMDSRQVLARFEAERQALAMMDHPNISKVLDAGATHSGRPYFVMELVRGAPITEFCDHNAFAPCERLELFVAVCRAVQHAHTKGVIHRDIKPTNVLVTLDDGVAVPKVIDFGVAKATGQQLTEKTLFTNFAQLVGTPLYMSPEQAEMTSVDVDTRSDVYSLGVLLYELLTGTTPLEKERLKRAAFDEVRRIIREEEPPRPSTRLSESKDSLPSISAQRRTEPARLTKLVRGELDWIVMKALEKNRTRRYETATGFARDIERYLHNEPVEACPPSSIYRIEKFVRRNKGPVLAGAVVLLTLVGGIVGTTFGLIRAQQARRMESQAKQVAQAREVEALEREAETKAVLEFVENKVFAAARPEGLDGGLGHDVTLRRAIEIALPFVDASFANQPLIEARLRQTLGVSFEELGEPEVAAKQLEKARTIRTKELGPDHPDTLHSMHNLANCYADLGRLDEALRLDEEAFTLRKSKLGLDHPHTLLSMASLANSYLALGRYAEALKFFEETLTLQKAKLGPDHPNTLDGMNNLAVVYAALGRDAEALKLCEETLALQKAKLGPDHPRTLTSMNNLAGSYTKLGRHAEALTLLEELLALQKTKLGPDHPDVLMGMGNLADIYRVVGRKTDAVKLLEEALPVMEAKIPDHFTTFICMTQLALSYDSLGRHEEALKLFDETLALQKAKLGPDHPRTLETMTYLAEVHAEHGSLSEAEKEYTAVVRSAPTDDAAALRLAFLRLAIDDHAGYEAIGRDMLARLGDPIDPGVARRTAHVGLVSDPPVGEIERLGQLADIAVAAGEAGEDVSFKALARRERGLAAYRVGDWDGALGWCRKSRELTDNRAWIAQNLKVEAMALHQQGKIEEARAAYDTAANSMNELFPEAPNQLGAGWLDWLIYRPLQVEAAALLGVIEKKVSEPVSAPTR